MKLQDFPGGFFIGTGLAVLGIGIAICGMASCEARSKEAANKTLTESFPYQQKGIEQRSEELKWQLEQGIISKEKYASEMNDTLIEKMFND